MANVWGHLDNGYKDEMDFARDHANGECDPSCDYCSSEESEEPTIDDTVNCCPECERANQFGETCYSCLRDIEAEL